MSDETQQPAGEDGDGSGGAPPARRADPAGRTTTASEESTVKASAEAGGEPELPEDPPAEPSAPAEPSPPSSVKPPVAYSESSPPFPQRLKTFQETLRKLASAVRGAASSGTKVGILGGKGSGKSYLFKAMVHRTLAGAQAGALSYYLRRDAVQLLRLEADGEARHLEPFEFLDDYMHWYRLAFTRQADQQRYRLRLHYRTGLLGRSREHIDVEFFDGAGEFFETPLNEHSLGAWKAAFLDAPIMVFCFPLWVAFPDAELMTEADWDEREQRILGFSRAVTNFERLRDRTGKRPPVRSILALTMADDMRCSLNTLKRRWIDPYLESPEIYLRALRKGGGVSRYLFNTRKISEAVATEFEAVADVRVSRILPQIEFGGGQPWLVPMSSIDGAALDSIGSGGDGHRGGYEVPPVPAHVELPLLLALCDQHNALM